VSTSLKDILEIQEPDVEEEIGIQGPEMSFLIEGKDITTINEQRALMGLLPLEGLNVVDPPDVFSYYAAVKEVAEMKHVRPRDMDIDYELVLKALDKDPDFQRWKFDVVRNSPFMQKMEATHYTRNGTSGKMRDMIATLEDTIPFDAYLYECKIGFREDIHGVIAKEDWNQVPG